MLKLPSSLVSADWLNGNKNDENLIILDASIKKVTGTGNKSPTNIGIPDSRFFDIENKFSDPNGQFPNTIPSEKQFQEEARKLGIDSKSAIVIYDDKGIYSSPRAWYMFKAFGHENVAVLDGGLPEWINSGLKVEERSEYTGTDGDFMAVYKPIMMEFIEDIEEDIKVDNSLILDARSAGRFNGTEAEPRAGLRSGTIPHSKSLPFTDLMEGYKMKSKSEIREIFESYDSTNRPKIFSCGSGITACVLALGADLIGEENYSVYDGSWTEWGSLKPE
ncbi:thiosulfate/3-mercaptopyruvate sulfurtransferase [Flavobacteriaceae bacterium MAR_2010_188]|nr:thiosulfate/3-mercaptopyruvate sulfurtransferase [Flavobacteriaceae bacterium MAR_2010_188]